VEDTARGGVRLRQDAVSHAPTTHAGTTVSCVRTTTGMLLLPMQRPHARVCVQCLRLHMCPVFALVYVSSVCVCARVCVQCLRWCMCPVFALVYVSSVCAFVHLMRFSVKHFEFLNDGTKNIISVTSSATILNNYMSAIYHNLAHWPRPREG